MSLFFKKEIQVTICKAKLKYVSYQTQANYVVLMMNVTAYKWILKEEDPHWLS